MCGSCNVQNRKYNLFSASISFLLFFLQLYFKWDESYDELITSSVDYLRCFEGA